jgi:hypothetical protein
MNADRPKAFISYFGFEPRRLRSQQRGKRSISRQIRDKLRTERFRFFEGTPLGDNFYDQTFPGGLVTSRSREAR